MTNKEDKNLMIQKAASGYTVCFANQCLQHEQCLRWIVGQAMPHNVEKCVCVNQRHDGVATTQCPAFRSSEKMRLAKGMKHLFTDDMPRRVWVAIRDELIMRYNRTYFFEYRNGKRLMPPAMQGDIRDVCRRHGWTADVQFDEYQEDYNW